MAQYKTFNFKINIGQIKIRALNKEEAREEITTTLNALLDFDVYIDENNVNFDFEGEE